MRALVGAGWFVVRSAGSHGEADLLALRPGCAVLVQCKRNGRLDPDEWAPLWALAQSLDAHAVLAYMDGRRTRYVELTAARGRGVRLATCSAVWTPTDPCAHHGRSERKDAP